MKKLYACLWVPDFPVAVKLRHRGRHPVPPALVFRGAVPNVFVDATNAPARSAGIQDGMPLAQARGRFAVSEMARSSQRKLLVYPRDEQAEEQTQRELLDRALTVSPRVESSGLGLLTLDLTGLPDPHGAASILADRAEQLGLAANIAVSQSRFVATCAARAEQGITHVFPHEATGFLHNLPASLLPLADPERKTLAGWGIHTIGEFARLPKNSLAARFGKRGARLAKLARGEDDTVFEAWQAPPCFEESLDFDWEISELESLSLPMGELLRALCAKLQRYHSAAAAVCVSLRLPGGSRFERTISLSYPLASAETLLRLIGLELAAHPPGDAVEGIQLAVKPVPRRVAQRDLFVSARPSPENLAITLARLQALAGSENIGAPAVCDTNHPRTFSMTPFEPESLIKKTSPAPVLGLRCFRSPVEAAVREESAQPVYIASRVASGRIGKCAGPWRMNGNWWSEDAWDFQEWDIELPNGLYRLSCKLPSHCWRLVGFYD